MNPIFFRKQHEIDRLKEECQQLKQQLKDMEEQQHKDHDSTSNNTIRLLFTNLNEKNVYLIDYENITMIPEFILKDAHSVCYIFYGSLQKAKLMEDERLHDFQGLHYIIPSKRTAKNSLDTLLSFYLGQIYSAYHPHAVFVISNDSDYSNLKRVSSYYPDIPYEQITLNEIKRREQNTASDDFFKRFLLDYIHIFGTGSVQRYVFVNRLKGSKVHGMDTNAIQYALHRIEDLHLIEGYTKRGKQYIRLLEDNIQNLANSIMKLEESYVY